MIDWLTGEIRRQVAFGHMGRVHAFMDEDVVPGLVSRRPGPGHGLVPLVAALECGIDIKDDAPIIEELVVHQLTDAKTGT